MIKSICLTFIVLLSFSSFSFSQKAALEGHWLIQKMISPDTENEVFEMNEPFFVKLVSGKMDQKIKDRGVSPDSVDRTMRDSIIQATAKQLYSQFKGVYMQFNSNNTYALSLVAGSVVKGTYKVNQKQKSVVLKGDLKETYLYTLKDGILTLKSEDGQLEMEMKKR